MEYKDTIIGIWGYGRVGRSVAHFFSKRGARILVWDDAAPHCPYPIAQSRTHLLETCTFIVPSPGIDISPVYTKYRTKWLAELDIFHQFWHKKLIAITGSLGKTTVTTLLCDTLTQAGWRVQSAGNIGAPCLDLIDEQHTLDAAILEVSSFQLEYCQTFAPDLALWTNLHPNHLDRHGSMDRYARAKCTIIAHQNKDQVALLSSQVRPYIDTSSVRSTLIFCEGEGIEHNRTLTKQATEILTGHQIPIAPCSLKHRLELIGTIGGALFINDSKSTTIESTRAAVEQYANRHIILFLGGLSKGVDRTPLIAYLATHNSINVICFGAEAQQLHSLCNTYKIPSCAHATLKEAFDACITMLTQSCVVLFSPSGSSFDLFRDYEERGQLFINCTQDHLLTCSD